MYKFRKGQIVLVSASLIIWAVWAAFAIFFRDKIEYGTELSTQFSMILVWSIMIYFVMLIPIVSPDMNLVSKNVNDDNRLKIVEIRRTMFCCIQLLFVFVACGTSVSLFYPAWKLGIGITVGLYLFFLALTIGVYFADFKKHTKDITAPVTEGADSNK